MNCNRFLFIPVIGFTLFSASIRAQNVQATGLPHFLKVNDQVYRGAQPSQEGWASLAKMGVKIVIDLRRDGEDGEHSTGGESKAVQAAGMRYVHMPMNGVVAPDSTQVAQIMTLLNSGEPVFVHCKKGMDRTGTVIACYRIGHDRWSNKQAMNEAKQLGLHFTQVGMKRYISAYQAAPAPLVETDAAVPATATTTPATTSARQ
jgi:uncharacterized protein (TIGR01244 family)